IVNGFTRGHSDWAILQRAGNHTPHREGQMMSRNFVRARSALVAVAAVMFSSVAAQAATSLSIAIAGEPWKDPSISSVGTKLSLATPPSTQSFGLGWSSSVPGAMGVNWQVKKAGAVVASGT